jgi:tetratricopeptide (TPR) repeat protein
MKKILLLILLTINTLTCLAVKVGEQAPELQIDSWINKGPVKLSDGKGKKIYVIEFWTTKSKESLKAMPFLHKLNGQYKDLTIVSISTERADAVKSFIVKYKKINFAIAIDKKSKTFNSYMQGNGKVPTAFIVNKNGDVAWIGHPLDLSLPLKRIITGKFDIKKSLRQKEIYHKIQILMSQKKYTESLKVIDDELKKNPDEVQFIALKTFVLFKLNKKVKALEFATEMLKEYPINMEIFDLKAHILGQMKKYKELDAFYLEFINNCKDEPVLLNQLARQLLGTRFGEAKLKPAMEASELAYSNRKLHKNQRPNIGETLARIYYMIGRIDRAITIQKVVCRIFKKNKNPKYIYASRILEYYQKAYKLGQGNQ